MYMIMFVLDNPEQLDDVLDAWQGAGVSGVTYLESSGFHRRQAHILGARFVVTLPALVERIENGSYTLLSVVSDMETVQACCRATEGVLGNLDEPNTGVLVAWEVAFAKGFDTRRHGGALQKGNEHHELHNGRKAQNHVSGHRFLLENYQSG